MLTARLADEHGQAERRTCLSGVQGDDASALAVKKKISSEHLPAMTSVKTSQFKHKEGAATRTKACVPSMGREFNHLLSLCSTESASLKETEIGERESSLGWAKTGTFVYLCDVSLEHTLCDTHTHTNTRG